MKRLAILLVLVCGCRHKVEMAYLSCCDGPDERVPECSETIHQFCVPIGYYEEALGLVPATVIPQDQMSLPALVGQSTKLTDYYSCPNGYTFIGADADTHSWIMWCRRNQPKAHIVIEGNECMEEHPNDDSACNNDASKFVTQPKEK